MLPIFAHNFYPQTNGQRLRWFWAIYSYTTGALGRLLSILCCRRGNIPWNPEEKNSLWCFIGFNWVTQLFLNQPLWPAECLNKSLIRGWGYHNRLKPIRGHLWNWSPNAELHLLFIMVQERMNQSHCSIISCLLNSKNMGVKTAFSHPLHARHPVNIC